MAKYEKTEVPLDELVLFDFPSVIEGLKKAKVVVVFNSSEFVIIKNAFSFEKSKGSLSVLPSVLSYYYEIYQEKLEPIPSYGDLFTLDDFIGMCKDGTLINSDGTGYYATEQGMSDVAVYPSSVMQNDISKKWTHVVWFNK